MAIKGSGPPETGTSTSGSQVAGAEWKRYHGIWIFWRHVDGGRGVAERAMIVDYGFDRMVDAVSPMIDQWAEDVVPGSVELLPNNRYSPRYAWMFSYEKRLKYRIEKVIGRPLGALERDLFGVDGVFSEALSNAFVHGHGRNPGRSIEIRCAVGRHGLVFSVRDQGPGFAVAKQLELARRGNARYHFAGNGLRALVGSHRIWASYAEDGRRLDLLAPFEALRPVR